MLGCLNNFTLGINYFTLDNNFLMIFFGYKLIDCIKN